MNEVAATTLCLDTNTYSALFRSEARARQVIGQAHRVILPAPVLAELRIGFMGGNRADANELALREFLDSPGVSVAPIDAATSLIYAQTTVALKASGTPLPINDVWIAACALQQNATLFSFDQHFGRVAAINAAFRWIS